MNETTTTTTLSISFCSPAIEMRNAEAAHTATSARKVRIETTKTQNALRPKWLSG